MRLPPRVEAVSSRAGTALTSSVMWVVPQRSFRSRRQGLRVAMVWSPSARIFGWARLTAFLPGGELVPAAAEGDGDGGAGAPVRIVDRHRMLPVLRASS